MYKDRDWLVKKYSIDKLSQKEIASICGVVKSVISVWLKKHSIPSNKDIKYKDSVWLKEQYENNNLSMSKIAVLCNTSSAVIHYWLIKYNIPTRSEYNTKKPLYIIKKRWVKQTKKQMKKIKQELVSYKGGCCVSCGYNKCLRALVFHHLDPSIKSFSISDFRTQAIDKLKNECDKCVLLCSNCHNEVHDGVLNLELFLPYSSI